MDKIKAIALGAATLLTMGVIGSTRIDRLTEDGLGAFVDRFYEVMRGLKCKMTGI